LILELYLGPNFNPMKRILVPVDFSPFSEKAQQIAVHLAQKTGAKVMLLHCVYTPLEWNRLTVKQQEEYPETVGYTVEAQIKLSKLAELPRFESVDAEYHIVHGTPYQQIVELATRYHVDLIVMGTHGNEKSDRPFLGSNSQRVIRMAPCPVLSVKHNAPATQWETVTFAADFEENSCLAFERLLPLVRVLAARVQLLFVNTPARFRTTPQAMQKMESFEKRFPDVSFTYHIYNQLDLQSGILEFTRTGNCDWIIMATNDREHTPMYQLGFTETVLFHSSIPVVSWRLQQASG